MHLTPGSVLLSYKDPGRKWWPPQELLNRYGHWKLLRYGERMYPGGDVRYDHVRIVCGPVFEDLPGLILGFEFTMPAARFFIFPDDPNHWMYSSSYSKLFRPTEEAMSYEFRAMSELDRARRVFHKCMLWDGTIYDIGQLLDMGFGFKRFFDFGKKSKVCSVGARTVLQGGGVLLPNLFPEVKVEKTPPCSWANSPYFEAVV